MIDAVVNPVEIRKIESQDAHSLRAFFERVPEGDRTFFREDVLADGLVDGWLADPTARRWIALDGQTIVGYVAVLPHVGWSSHVGDLRLVIDPAHRRSGYGKTLARGALLEALALGLTKVAVEIVAEQESAVAMFRVLGFEPEALLKGQVRDAEGGLHDLLIMSHFVDDTWALMQTAGLEDAVG